MNIKFDSITIWFNTGIPNNRVSDHLMEQIERLPNYEDVEGRGDSEFKVCFLLNHPDQIEVAQSSLEQTFSNYSLFDSHQP